VELSNVSPDALWAEIMRRAGDLEKVPTPVLVAELKRRGEERVVGIRQIADALGYNVKTVIAWTQLVEDPLRLDFDGHSYSIARAMLVSWFEHHKRRRIAADGPRGKGKRRKARQTRSKLRAAAT